VLFLRQWALAKICVSHAHTSRSDDLPVLLAFVEKSAEIIRALRISRFRLVIDANPVLRDFYWMQRPVET
jgi:hypothetical protein